VATQFIGLAVGNHYDLQKKLLFNSASPINWAVTIPLPLGSGIFFAFTNGSAFAPLAKKQLLH
jgi:hypothetical protein